METVWRRGAPELYVRASMSIPYFFSPLRAENVPQGEEARERWDKLAGYKEDPPRVCTFVDGGIMSNFLDMTDEAKLDLFFRGAHKAAEFLRGFDWAGYKQIREQKKQLYAVLA